MIGRNCSMCRRWIPGFVLVNRPSPTCSSSCHRSYELLTDNLAHYLAPETSRVVRVKNKPMDITKVRCGGCGAIGHTAKSKTCPQFASRAAGSPSSRRTSA